MQRHMEMRPGGGEPSTEMLLKYDGGGRPKALALLTSRLRVSQADSEVVGKA